MTQPDPIPELSNGRTAELPNALTRVSARIVARALGVSLRNVQRWSRWGAAVGPGERGGREKTFALEMMPAHVRVQVEALGAEEEQGGRGAGEQRSRKAGERWEMAREPDRLEVMRRLAVLAAWGEYCQRAAGSGQQAATTREETKKTREFLGHWNATHPDGPISKTSLYRWRRAFRDGGREELLPQRDAGGEGPRLDPILKERFHTLYMSQNRITVATARDVLAGHLILEHSELQDQVPSLTTFHRYVQTIPLQARILAREGSDAYRRKCQPFLPRDFSDYRVMQRWVADHYNFKMWVYHEGRVFRPWLTQWLDVRSRLGVGEYIGDGPSQETVLASLADGVLRYGAPEELWSDNGFEFSSPTLAGKSRRWRVKINAPRVQAMVSHLHATWHFSIPHEPQSRGVIERWFGVTLERFDKLFASYCGRDISEKPDDLNQLLKTPRALPTLTEVRQKFRLYMDQVANETVSEGQGMEGQSPRVVFEGQTYEKRTATKEALSLLFMRCSTPVRVGQNGIKVWDRYYGGVELAPQFGQQVYYRYRPEDLGELYVFSFPEQRYLCTVQRRDASGVTSEDYRRIQHEKKMLRTTARAYQAKREAHAAIGDPIAALAAAKRRQAEERGTPPAGATPSQTVVRPIARGLEAAAREIREERKRTEVRGQRSGGKRGDVIDMLAAQRGQGSPRGPGLPSGPQGEREESGEEKATRMLDKLAKFSGIGG